MGDVQTHRAIYKVVRAGLEEVRPDEDYAFIRLGNYLTDLSQVRDTLAYALGKLRIWKDARQQHWAWTLNNFSDAPEYLNELFGHPAHVEGAALAEYLEDLVLAATLGSFTHRERQDSDDLLPEEEVVRVFKRNFTRYYPHEHLDFPPWPYTDPLGDRTVDTGAHLLRSLTEQIPYVVESLTAVQRAWTRALGQDRSAPARHDVLADLGHALHAIEDFYFHTDFLELHELQRSLQQLRSAPAPAPDLWSWFADHALDGISAENDLRWRRLYFRRLRAPIKADKGEGLSTVGSAEAVEHVSTGGFGATDIFHTIYGALLALQTSPLFRQLRGSQTTLPPGVRPPDIILFRYILDEQHRRDLINRSKWEIDQKRFDKDLELHKKQLVDPRTDRYIVLAFQAGVIRASEAAALKRALATDRRITKKYPGLPGVGGFLMRMLLEVQKEHDRSAAASDKLDGDRLVLDRRTSNGASSETIGTHSLLSKDTEHSLPFRTRAVSFASFASGFAARTMVERLSSTETLDWLPVVRHFLRYPRVHADSWEEQLRQASDRNTRLRAADLRDRPEVKAIPPDSKLGTLRSMRLAAQRLGKRYDDEAMKAYDAWLHRD